MIKERRRSMTHLQLQELIFYYFIESIYNNCKKNRIESTSVIQWIHDLLEFDPPLPTENSNYVSPEFEQDIDEQKRSQSEMTKKSHSWESEAKLIDREIQVPFISKINSFIQQKKSNVQNLDSLKATTTRNKIFRRTKKYAGL